MTARIFFQMFTLLVLFQVGGATRGTSKSPSASVDNGQCDLCKELTTIKDLIRQIIRPGGKKTGVQGEILSEPACKFDFEGGIHDWDRTGTAFNNQPTYGDNPTARNRGQPANQQGDWWIGGAENRSSKAAPAGLLQGDEPRGTLMSPYFTITGKYIFFLIGGGCDIKFVRAELIIGNKVVETATGKCTETMTRTIWDVGAYIDQHARVKLVDFSSGEWGHINFDDLKGDMSCLQGVASF